MLVNTAGLTVLVQKSKSKDCRLETRSAAFTTWLDTMMSLAGVAPSELQRLKADPDMGLEVANADAWRIHLRPWPGK